MKFVLEVKQEDIDYGVPQSTKRCPIALAAVRQGYPVVSFARVDRGTLRLYSENRHPEGGKILNREIWRLPTEATQFVLKFDGNIPVQPCSFEFTELIGREDV